MIQKSVQFTTPPPPTWKKVDTHSQIQYLVEVLLLLLAEQWTRIKRMIQYIRLLSDMVHILEVLDRRYSEVVHIWGALVGVPFYLSFIQIQAVGKFQLFLIHASAFGKFSLYRCYGWVTIHKLAMFEQACKIS